MATSPNYSWPEPDNTDLVKNGALAIRTLGNAIDTTMATMTPKSTYTAKGSIAAATGASTPANLSVGNNGETLVADSSATTGLRWQGNYAAGKNKIINGDFKVWQRGSSFSGTNQLVYTADRWLLNDFGGQVSNVARSTFTPGTAPVAGYEGEYYATWSRAGAGTASSYLQQKIEDVRTFAGQTITFSFWAKAAATESVDFYIDQNFGSGGSATVGSASTSFTLTTSWVRYTATLTLASISGKTVGTSSFLAPTFQVQTSQGAYTIDIWGVQLEAGSTATAFQTATGTVQGELAACQRYFYRAGGDSVNDRSFASGVMVSTTIGKHVLQFPVQMRTAPTVTYSAAGTFYLYGGGGGATPSAMGTSGQTTQNISVEATRSVTAQNLPSFLQALGTANAFIDSSSEL